MLINNEVLLISYTDLKPYTFCPIPLILKLLHWNLSRMISHATSSIILLDVYSPVSARASIGRKDGALFE